MKKKITNEKDAFSYLRDIMYLKDIKKLQNLMDLFFEQLINSKWNRERIYKFIFVYVRSNLSEKDYDEISEYAFDYLGDIESSVIGHCSYDSILKFPDEPENKDELIAYVRGDKWRN
ncbi:hypothetical protein [Pectobacterium polaris]|uniref:hypothetical protein n=1 Tax=Pectobacterium polaris TaxID=2042057 RepID=UPI000A688052|nr:hypothetical protein [Pectobacterium polaris]ASY75414.1 hypothetical protein BJJ97_05520 [Pectobacterium polaris]